MRLKRFLMASALALSFVVSAPTVAKADPITAAIVTWAGFTAGTTAFAVATFVVNSALYAAGSWAVTKAAKALGLMKSNVAERQASVTTLSLGETPREAVVGIACVGGSLIDAWNHGGKYGTDYVTRRVALADHVLDGLIGYYVDDTYYPFATNGVQPGFNGALQLTFVNATRDGAAPPGYMLQAGVGLTSEDRCPSVAEIWATYKFDDQVWTRGHPGLKFVVRGLRTYDPRFDPQHGYTGPSPQTWEDVTTHRFSENAAVVRYNIQRGVFAVGRHGELQHLLIGRGLSADEAPAGRIIAAANVCDEIVNGRPRYTVGGAISSAQAHIEVEEMFAAATAGQIVQRDGGVEVEPGQAKAAVVTITDADLVAGEAISFDEFTPDTDGGRINTVIARYVEPSQIFKDHSGSVLRRQADIVEDGGPRELTLPLMLVTNREQADRCAEITRRGARLERRARIALVPMLLAGRASAELEDGDIVAWQSNRYHEGATVRYRIEAYGVDEGWRNTLQLREMASSVFGQEDPIEDQAAPPPPPAVIDALALDEVQVEPIILPGEKSVIPALRFFWEAPVDPAIQTIRAEVRIKGETDIAPTTIGNVNDGAAVVTAGVAPGRILQGRLVPVGPPHRPVMPSAWTDAATGELVAGDLAPGAPTAVLAAQHTDLIAAEMLRGALYRSYTDGLLHLDGQPVATLFQSLSDQVINELGSFAGTLNLLGAKNQAGTGFIIAADQVFLPATETGGQVTSLRGLQLTTATNKQSIQQLFTLTDGFAESKTLLVVNDVVTGIVNQNDGSIGSLQFQADVFAFVDPNGGSRVVPFSYGVDNILRLTNTIIHGDLVVTGSLTNRALVKNTITGLAVADTSGVVTLTGTTAKTVQSVWIEVKGEDTPVKLLFNGLVLMLHNASGSFSATFEFRRAPDGGQGISLRSRTVDATGDTYDAVAGSYVFTLNDVPGPGVWRYFVTVRSTANNMSVQQLTDPYMEAVEYRNNAA